MNNPVCSDKNKKNSCRQKLFHDIFLFFAVVLWFGLFAWYDVDWHHDGIMLGAVAQVLEQKVLFRDIFCQYGPLSIWIQCVPAALFGAETLVIRLTTVVFYGFIAILGTRIWSRFVKAPFLWIWYFCFFALCPFYLVSFHPWSSVYALFFMLLGLEFQLRFLEDPALHGRLAMWSGVCAAAAFLCRTPCGVVTFAAGTIVMLLYAAAGKKEKRFYGIKVYTGGAVAVLALFAAYLLAAGAWEDYWLQCFSYVYKFASGSSGGNFLRGFLYNVSTDLDPYGTDCWIFVLFAVITAAVLAVTGWKVCFRRENTEKSLSFLAVVLLCAASLHQYFPVPCVRHFWWAAIPAFGLYALTAQKIWALTCKKYMRVLLLCCLFAPLASPCLSRAVSVAGLAGNISQMQICRLPGMRYSLVLKEENKFLQGMSDAFNAQPAEIRNRGVINNTPDGLFCCMMPLPPKYYHPMFVNWYDNVYADYYQAVRYTLGTQRPMILSTMVDHIGSYELVFTGRRRNKTFWLFAPLPVDGF